MDFDINTLDPIQFDRFFEIVTGKDLPSLSDEDLDISFSLLQHAADRILSEMGKRRTIKAHDGRPCLPMLLPDGLDVPPTILNGGQPWP